MNKQIGNAEGKVAFARVLFIAIAAENPLPLHPQFKHTSLMSIVLVLYRVVKKWKGNVLYCTVLYCTTLMIILIL